MVNIRARPDYRFRNSSYWQEVRTIAIVKGEYIVRRMLNMACCFRIEEIAVTGTAGLSLETLTVGVCQAQSMAYSGIGVGMLAY